MDDSLSSFNLTNYRVHPSREDHYIFFFQRDDTADSFEEMLKENGHFYQRDKEDDEEREIQRHLFAIKRHELEYVKKLNYTAIGTHRTNFISDPIIRWGLFAIFALAMGMAVWGFIVTNLAE